MNMNYEFKNLTLTKNNNGCFIIKNIHSEVGEEIKSSPYDILNDKRSLEFEVLQVIGNHESDENFDSLIEVKDLNGYTNLIPIHRDWEVSYYEEDSELIISIENENILIEEISSIRKINYQDFIENLEEYYQDILLDNQISLSIDEDYNDPFDLSDIEIDDDYDEIFY